MEGHALADEGAVEFFSLSRGCWMTGWRAGFVAGNVEAVAALRKKGITAKRLEDGFPEWKNAGLPVATGGIKPTDDS